MRRLYTWLAGAAGGLAAYRAATRLKHEPATVVVDPAEELRAKLAQARDADVETAPVATTEPPAEPEAPTDADSRRRAVHEGARATLDEMHGEE